MMNPRIIDSAEYAGIPPTFDFITYSIVTVFDDEESGETLFHIVIVYCPDLMALQDIWVDETKG
jgi:hypothetical protein